MQIAFRGSKKYFRTRKEERERGRNINRERVLVREIGERERKRGKYRESVCEREGKRERGGGREKERE